MDKLATLQRMDEILIRLKTVKNPIIAEVGVFKGDLSKKLLERSDLSLYMIDLWKAFEKDSEYAKSGDWHGALSQSKQDKYLRITKEVTAFAQERAIIIQKDSIEASKDFKDYSLDLVFLDADHTYAGVKADIEAWVPKVKSGGWLSGHDYNNIEFESWGVKQAVDELNLHVELGENFTWFINLI